MAWSVLQSVAAAPFVSGTTTSVTFTTANLTSGTKLICYFAYYSGTVSSVKDGAGNSFTQVLADTVSFTQVDVWVLDTPAGDVGTKPTITVTISSASQAADVLVQEVSGLAAGTTGSLDGTPGATGTNTAAAGTYGSPTYSSTAASEYLFSVYAANYANSGNSVWTAPSGYTADPNSVNNNTITLAVAYKNSSNGTESAAWSDSSATSSFANTVVLGAFKLLVTGTDSGPNYAATGADLGGGTGSWTTPAGAQSAPDSSYAVWTPP